MLNAGRFNLWYTGKVVEDETHPAPNCSKVLPTSLRHYTRRSIIFYEKLRFVKAKCKMPRHFPPGSDP